MDYDIEDHATLAPLTVALTRKALRHVETILAIEALLAVDALDRAGPAPCLGAGTRATYDAIHDALAAIGVGASSSGMVEAVRGALAEP